MDIEIILEPDLTPQQVAEIAVAAEEAGARTLWHSNYHDNWDAFVALVPAAQATSKIRLGVLAVSPYEMHPLKIANAILSLNELSSGRAIIAIGGGGAVLSATDKNVDFMDFKKKRIVLGVREAVEIVKAACSGEQTMGYDGELFKVTRPFKMDWAESESPKVYSCTNAPQMVRMGARVADGMQLSDMTMHRAGEVMENVQAGLAKREHPADDFRIGNFWAWHIKEDREKSMWEARRSLVWRAQLVSPFTGLEEAFGEKDAQLVKDNFSNFAKAYWTRSGEIEGVPDELVSNLVSELASAGDLGDIDRELERYREFEKAGLTDLALKLYDEPMDGLKIIRDHVIPYFS